MAGAAFGSCLKGWGVVARAAVGPRLAWHSQHFGDASVKSWQAQYFVHLGLRLRGRGSIWELSKELSMSGCFYNLRSSIDVSVAHLHKHRHVGLSGPLILMVMQAHDSTPGNSARFGIAA